MITKRIEYYDNETGEIFKEQEFEIKDLSVRFKVGSGKGQKASRFSKVFQMEDPMFNTANYYQYFYKCLLHLEMGTNRLVEFTEDGELNSALDEKDLAKLFNCSIKTVNRFLDYCSNKNLIARFDKNKELFGYIINPLYALNGNKITSTLYLMFNEKGQLDKHIPFEDLKSLKEYLKTKPLLDTYDQVN